MSLELNRTIKPSYCGDKAESAAFVLCQEAALKIAEVLLTKGEVCAFVDKLSMLLWVGPFDGRLQLATSPDLRSNTPITDDMQVQIDFVEDFCCDEDGFIECAEAFEEWLSSPVFEAAGAYKAGIHALKQQDAWCKAYAQLVNEGWSETGSNVVTKPGCSAIWYGWSALINKRMKENEV